MGEAKKKPQNRRPRPYPVDPGTIIRIVECAECKGRAQLKIDAASKAYYHCPHADNMGVPCGHRVIYGAAKSEAIRKGYLEKQHGPQSIGTANQNRAPAPRDSLGKSGPANIDAKPNRKDSEYDEYDI